MHVDRHRGGLEDGRQPGGVHLQDLAVIFLTGGGQYLLVNAPRPVGVGGGVRVAVVTDVVDAEVVVI